MACSDIIEPKPLTLIGSGCLAHTAASCWRNSSPRAVCASATSAVNTWPSTAPPAVIVAMLLLNVPAWLMTFVRAPGVVSYWSSRSARPPKAPKEKPPPMYLP